MAAIQPLLISPPLNIQRVCCILHQPLSDSVSTLERTSFSNGSQNVCQQQGDNGLVGGSAGRTGCLATERLLVQSLTPCQGVPEPRPGCFPDTDTSVT